jgi:hypothetical protein
MIFYIWLFGFIIFWIFDNIRYNKILEEEAKAKNQMKYFGFWDRFFHYRGSYLFISGLYFIWLFFGKK